MPPRFIERINRKAETIQNVFDHECSPPSYMSRRSSLAESEPSFRPSSQNSKTLSTPPPSYIRSSRRRSSLKQPALPRDSHILVTGANSFQGIHIVDQLLEHGYRVRGTVRDADKARWTSKYFEVKYGVGRYSTAIVPDMAVKGAFDMAIQGCSGIIHVASVTTMSPDPNEVITPTIAGALNALEAAANEPGVLRFVLTSSIAAAISYDRGHRKDVSSHTWNMMDFSDAWSPQPYDDDRAIAVYSSSKMQTEATVRRWCEVHKPKFVLNTVLADTLFGRILDPIHQAHPLSVTLLKAIFDGQTLDYPPCNFVDVQDSALLHVAALILPDVQDQRIFAVSCPWNVRSLVQLMKGLFPYRKIEDNLSDLGTDQTFFKEAHKAEELLVRMGRNGWTDIVTSVQRNCEAFV